MKNLKKSENKRRLVVLTGAGISAESGISTFRDSNGLWEGHDIMEVASPEGWRKDKAKVLEFYNQRRKNAWDAQPNAGHLGLKNLEEAFNVQIVTQNVDNLHEKAGSKNILHLHGELLKSRSTLDSSLIYDMKSPELNIGDKCEMGSQLRPHIVWFGEAVSSMEEAIEICSKADILLIIGTSMVVYPAAGLCEYVPKDCPIYVINPADTDIPNHRNKVIYIRKTAVLGIKEFIEEYSSC